MKVAHEVVVNAKEGSVTIDGLRFPFYVGPDIEFELTGPVNGAPAIVHLGLIAENVRYISEDGTARVPTQSDDETNRRWARTRAKEIVVEGMMDVLAWLNRPAP